MTTLLFDLDGTLVDSSPGILSAFSHTFHHLGQPLPPQEDLLSFIGPPLETTLANYFTDKDLEEALATFRDYYAKTGVYQYTLYDGVKAVLEQLTAAGYQLFVTTSKNQEMAQVMMTEQGLDTYFTGIYGAVQDRHHKADVIQACLADHHLDLTSVSIIGDTKYDMIGGKAIGIQTIGVTWGFGSKESLLQHGADLIIDHMADLLSYFP